MTRMGPKTDALSQWEARLLREKQPRRREALIDRITAHYVYTDTNRALALLAEQDNLLADFPDTEYQLNFHYFSAVIENQLYHFHEAARHYLDALILAEEQGDPHRRLG